MKYDEFIHDRGRGPEIKGTRITVYSILDFMIAGWHCERIADLFQVHPEEVQAAMDYVRANTLEVLREYVKMLERCARGNPPEIQARLDATHEKFQELLKEVREVKDRAEGDVRGLIRQYRTKLAKDHANARNHSGQ